MNITNTEPWTLEAKCRDKDPELFYPGVSSGQRARQREAKAVCEFCPVKAECLAYAMRIETTNGHRYGVFGGTTPEDRMALHQAAKESS